MGLGRVVVLLLGRNDLGGGTGRKLETFVRDGLQWCTLQFQQNKKLKYFLRRGQCLGVEGKIHRTTQSKRTGVRMGWGEEGP